MIQKSIIVGLLISSLGIQAQSDSTAKELESVVITANRFPQKQINTGKVLTVISRKEIDESPFNQLGELLNRQVGLSVIGANNSPGTNPDVYMRGAGTGNALILIDGSPASDASTIRSTFDLNFISLADIERIEILKGGQSTVYGSDAVAGVINIITRKNQLKKFTPSISLSRGSFQTNMMHINLSGRSNMFRYKIQYNNVSSNGFSSALDTTSKRSYDKDGLTQQVYKAEIGSIGKKNWEWNINTQLSRYKNDMDETSYEDARDSKVGNKNIQVIAGLTKKIKSGNIRASFVVNNSTRNYLDDSIYLNGFSKYIKSDFTGKSYFAELYGSFKLTSELQILAGIDHKKQSTDQYYYSVSDYGEYKSMLKSDTAYATLTSAMTSLVYNSIKNINIESGIRYNKHSRYGDNITFTFNPSYIYKNVFKTSLNISSAYKAPTLYQLFDGYSGERNLKPETSITSEASIQLIGIKRINSRVTYFNRRIKHGIDYNYESYKYFNYNLQKDHGLEVELGYKASKWNFSYNYTYTSGKVTATHFEYDTNNYIYIPKGDTTYSHLFRIPQHGMNGNIGYQLSKKIFTSISQRIVGKRFEPVYASHSVELKPYMTTDLFCQYTFNKNTRFYISLKNILNKSYQDILGYTTMGRNYTIGIRWGM